MLGSVLVFFEAYSCTHTRKARPTCVRVRILYLKPIHATLILKNSIRMFEGVDVHGVAFVALLFVLCMLLLSML